MNWLSLPFSYAYAVLILIAFFLPPLQGLIAVLWLALLLSEALQRFLGVYPA
jgi:hypothetical protein